MCVAFQCDLTMCYEDVVIWSGRAGRRAATANAANEEENSSSKRAHTLLLEFESECCLFLHS